jgi:FKBP-type peptidyl-prolyl cis-trans isomerase
MMNKTNYIFISLLLTSIFLFSSCENKFDEKKVELKTHQDSISYIIGYDYGEGIALKGLQTSKDALLKGLLEGMTGESSLSDTLISQLVLNFQQEIDARENEMKEEFIKSTIEQGNAYLAKNKTLEGITELDNGLQYKVIKQGIGDIHPQENDSVTIHFRAMFIDGTTFDMSYDQGPAGVRLNRMIKGLSQGIQLMKPEAIYDFYIPYYLAYGENDFANVIPGGSSLHYHVELIKINK